MDGELAQSDAAHGAVTVREQHTRECSSERLCKGRRFKVLYTSIVFFNTFIEFSMMFAEGNLTNKGLRCIGPRLYKGDKEIV